MNPPAVESQETDPELLRALAGRYVDYHGSVDNYILAYSVEFWLVRRLGIEPRSWPGHLAGGMVQALIVLLPALILAATTGQWTDAPLLTWTGVALVWGATATVGLPLYETAISNLLSWLETIVDAADLRRLLAWQYRWYSHRVLVPVSVVLTLGAVLPLFLVLRSSGTAVAAGTLYICAFLFFMVMQNACSLVMVAFEIHNLSTCRYALYRLSPADSVAVRLSVRGYNQLGAINVIVATMTIVLFLALLPGGSRLVTAIAMFLLIMEFLWTAMGTLVPRLIMGRIIRSSKEEEMRVLQRWLDDLLPRIRELTDEEYKEMKRLQETQDTIRNSPENLLPLGAILRTAGALLLSTLTVLLTAFAQEWIAGLAQRILP